MPYPTFGTTNFIKTLFRSDCAAPFSLYLETFGPAFLRYFLFTRLWLWDDLVRAIGSAKAGARDTGRGVRHGRLRRLPAAPIETVSERYSRKALNHLLYFTEPLERIGYTLLIVAGADQLFTDWQAALLRLGACGEPIGAGPLQRGLMNGAFFPLPGGGTALLPDLVQNRSGWDTNSATVTLPTGIWRVTLAASVTGPAGPPVPYRWTLQVEQPLLTFDMHGPETELGYSQPADVVASFQVFGSLSSTNKITWLMDGPGIPVGMKVKSARVIVYAEG